MPECLNLLLSKLSLKESIDIWHWLDECPDAIDKMIAVVVDKIGQTDLGDTHG